MDDNIFDLEDDELLFLGTFRHFLDEKNRIRIPAKLKEGLGDNPFITKGSNGSLLVYRKKDAKAMLKKMFKDAKIADSPQTRSLRLMASSGGFADEDKQGRITLSPELLEHAAIKKNIVTIGAIDRVEIWSEENWNDYSNVSREEFDKCLSDMTSNNE